ncbi:hypothetical protein MATL_G00237310 [Megalops atlanticus]|uniref:Uncharacterized protein n=1 Tax=Megalops atlanticus TaxID=7932 RepID=A0A9D3SX49_MEGAT|nr:hypothetical protein MATL_G00237310 [Megalops atlanticus]
MQRNRISSSASFLSSERQRDSLEQPEAERVAMATPSCAVRRRFSGTLQLPPLSRRHSTQDTHRTPDPEGLSKAGARSLETVRDAHAKARLVPACCFPGDTPNHGSPPSQTRGVSPSVTRAAGRPEGDGPQGAQPAPLSRAGDRASS